MNAALTEIFNTHAKINKCRMLHSEQKTAYAAIARMIRKIDKGFNIDLRANLAPIERAVDSWVQDEQAAIELGREEAAQLDAEIEQAWDAVESESQPVPVTESTESVRLPLQVHTSTCHIERVENKTTEDNTMTAQTIATPAMTSAQLKKLAKRYNVTLTGDARRKGVKQQWIDAINNAANPAPESAPQWILDLVMKTGNFNIESAKVLAQMIWETAHTTERTPMQKQLSVYFTRLVNTYKVAA